jgi:small-conductance mechanosensitive channel
MKKMFSLLSFALLSATFCAGAQSLTKPADAYAEAVAAYVEAANREMVALHTKVEGVAKTADEQDKAKCEEIKRQLDECDRLLDRLTSANRGNFDKIKSAYEQERSDALKAIDALTKK